MASNERPESAVGNVMFHRRGVNLNVWLTGDLDTDASRLRESWNALELFLRGLSPEDREEVLKEQQRGGFGGRGGGGGRADRFPPIEGMKCDKCQGPVGRKPKTGGMRNDAAVCLGSCKDPGKDGKEYVHTVTWLDGSEQRQEPAPQPQGEKKERTVGDFLTWCHREFGLTSAQVCQLLGVAGAADIRDLAAATKRVKESQKVSA